MLWMGLVLLGLLGFPQTPAQGHDTVQPNFQQDKVRRPPTPHPKKQSPQARARLSLTKEGVLGTVSLCACAWELAGTTLAHSLVGPPDSVRNVVCSDIVD